MRVPPARTNLLLSPYWIALLLYALLGALLALLSGFLAGVEAARFLEFLDARFVLFEAAAELFELVPFLLAHLVGVEVRQLDGLLLRPLPRHRGTPAHAAARSRSQLRRRRRRRVLPALVGDRDKAVVVGTAGAVWAWSSGALSLVG